MITLKDIQDAKSKMKDVVHETPLDYSKTFSDISNNHVFLKLENLQKTGSFKVRGAYNKIMSLSKEEREKGVIAASAGNHAQGVAFASSMAGIKSTIVMPKGATLTKVEATKQYGAEVVLYGSNFDEALEHASNLQKENGSTFIHPFDDEKIMAGQGTIGIEIIEQLKDVDAVVVPIGGGGLISGIIVALKEINPKIKIYGVEAEACPSMKSSLEQKKPVKILSNETIADGIAVKCPGQKTFEVITGHVDDIVTVNEVELSQTMLHLLERNKQLVEGSGAAALAAILYNKIPMTGKKVVPIVSGGNVDINFVSRLIEHGLVEAGRYAKFSTLVPDKPGQLNRLLSIIAELEANVLSVHHQRMGTKVTPGKTEISFSLETKNNDHIEEVRNALLKSGYEITEIV